MQRDGISVFQAVRVMVEGREKRQSSKEGQTPSRAIRGNTQGARVCAWPGNPEMRTQRHPRLQRHPRATAVVVKDKARS